MKKGFLIPVLLIVFLVIILFMWGSRAYNRMVTMEEAVTASGVMLKPSTSAGLTLFPTL
jgi:hypothetical protein